jgi:ABC-type amino acid transport substrate-binding protein
MIRSQIGHWSLVILHCLLLIVLAACARPDDTWDRVREAGILRVGMDASFPPFETIAADGTLVGFDVDLARELGRRLGPALPVPSTAEGSEAEGPALSVPSAAEGSKDEGIEVQFVANLPYDGLYDALAVGHVDAVVSALVVNPARMADFAYSTPYFDAGHVLVVREGEAGTEGQCPELVEGMTDGSTDLAEVLSGRVLAVEFGTQGDLEARKWARRLSDLTVVPRQTAAEALATVVAGEADAALVDHVSALAAIGRECGLLIVGEPIVEEPYAVAVRRESRHLLQAINEVLAEMEADGTMERLVAEWLEGGP